MKILSAIIALGLSGCMHFIHPDGSYSSGWLRPNRTASVSPIQLIIPTDYEYHP